MLLAGNVSPADADSLAQEVNSTLIIVLNAYSNPVSFTLPQTEYDWNCIFTTGIVEPSSTALIKLVIEPRSVQLFELQM